MPFENLFEEVKNSYDIVEVISSYVRLKRVGKNFVGFCPFHSEKIPSFVVSPEKQIFKCFGCGAAGDVVTFYAKIKALSFKEALLELAEKAGIQVDKKFFIEKKKEKNLAELNYKIAKFYHHLLYFHSSSEDAKKYLEERGLSEETIKTFLLGFAPNDGRVLAGYLRNSSEDLTKGEELGLIKRTSDGSYIDLFRGRIIFPIFNLKGECVGFGARALDKEIEPKYLNTPESKLFKKSEILYGLYQAKEFIKKKNLGILVEGYFDFLSLWEKGIKNVVATCGTALTENHVKLIKAFTENWVIFYDGDLAGKKAALRAISLFLKEGILPKCITISEEEDPDSWVRKQKLEGENLENKIEELIVDAISFVINFYKEDYVLNPSKAFKEIMEVFKSTKDPLLRNRIAREISFHLGVPENEILKWFIKDLYREEIPEEIKGKDKEDIPGLRSIAQFLVNYPEYYFDLEASGLSKLLEFYLDTLYGKFLKYLIEEFKKGKSEADYIPDMEFQEILSDLLLDPPFENKEEALNHIKTYIRKELAKKEIRKVTENLKLLQIKGPKEEIEKYLWILKSSITGKLLKETKN
ncbi:MAG: DNA primase [Thermodesulfobacterium geofontis]|uniref:DNA primase n=3 Tax=Thermodesulfobacterium geofontis TaxID=1295609 RepID=A0A2N7PP49_9BACT|nr:MAG: DNA primase [Thermodesulfobacterium geofontis]